MAHPLVVGITGASGAIYAVRLLECLIASGRDVHLSISDAGRMVLQEERTNDIDFPNSSAAALLADIVGRRQVPQVSYFDARDFFAPMASGSFLTSGMTICPCSGGTLQAVAGGNSSNLIQRAAEVHLKERRKLVLVPRETPLSLSHIDNLRRAYEAGAVILPASPGWYHGVRSLRDLVDFIVARILDQFGVEHELMRRWGEEPSGP